MLLACSDAGTLVTDAGARDAATEKKVAPGLDASDEPSTGPEHLADTGLYADFAARTIAPGVLPYSVRYPLWTDGAVRKRYFLLPSGTKIDTSSMDDWVFPVGTKAWVETDVGGRALETHVLWKRGENEWWKASYAWNADGTDAVLSEQDCSDCHDDVRDQIVGVSALQIGASDGDGTLSVLAAAGAFSAPPASAYDAPGAGATKEALGYLHGNCGHCHSAIGGESKQSAMRLRLSVADVAPERTDAYRTSRFLVMRHPVPPDVVYALLPGDSARSGIAARMARRDSFAMPPDETAVVDDVGLAAVRTWIASLSCGNPCTSALAPP